MCVLLLFVLDVLVTNGIYIAFHDVYGNLFNIVYLDFNPMDMFFSESFQIGVILVFRYFYEFFKKHEKEFEE